MADQATLSVMLRQSEPIPLDLEFCCDPTQALAIFGPSGSGKTTILRSIAGLHHPQEGLIRSGDDIWLDTANRFAAPPHTRAVGFVFQDSALFPHLSALGNVAAALGHLGRTERRRVATQMLDVVGARELADRSPLSLSGGERQRVALARALARRPRILLLDEPFASVDRTARRQLLAEIDSVRRLTGVPVVLVTHDFDDVVQWATHLMLLHKGRAVAQGAIADVTSRPDLAWLQEAVGLGTVLDAAVMRRDATRGLVELSFDGGVLFAPDQSEAVGTRLRVRVPSRNIILASERPTGLSVHNVLGGTVTAVHELPDRHLCVVQVAVGGTRFLAEVTRDAVTMMRLAAGAHTYLLIKSVSLRSPA